jgi:A/G-specific adenine glycosylase
MNNFPYISSALLEWYDRHRRQLPWRALPGEPREPYRIWLSEIMLQQTVVAAVIPYFQRFVAAWPRVEDLAAAPLDDILREWAGLGYYARARNLHRCAQTIVAEHGGQFPQTIEGLLSLPGIGPYTAGAIAAIAFDLPHAAVDGNVERVVSRLAALATPLPAVKPEIRRLAEQLVPHRRAGDFAQALMDLGATICTPASPKCLLCPLNTVCAAYVEGTPANYPRRLKKSLKPTRYGHIFWLEDKQENVLLRRRPEQGLLGGMMEFPSSPWLPQPSKMQPLYKADWRTLPETVLHTFTHFHLELTVHAATIAIRPEPPGIWLPPARFAEVALPTVMRKVANHALNFLR